MDVRVLEQYVDRVYGWAVKRTYSVEEAEELSQEILFTAVREFAKLKNKERLEPWLWGVASNVAKAFRRSLGKQRAMYSYDVPLDLPYEELQEGEEEEELCAFLRGRIAMLSAIYRDIVIFYYYDGLSTKQISEKLGIPEGTVTWRLSRAREKLKNEYMQKECADMEETALRPVRMRIDIYGSGNYDGDMVPFPSDYITDALSQNICYHCYEKPRNVEEISKLTGVPAYYIEENIKNLLKRQALISLPKDRYQTDFVIWTDKFGMYCRENAEAALLPVMDRMIAALKGIAKEAGQIGFYKAGKGETELFYLYGVLALEQECRKYHDRPYPEMEKRYDGFRWRYVASMETGAYPRTGLGVQRCGNLGSRGNCSHTVYKFTGFCHRQMMKDDWINACEDILTKGGSEDKGSVAYAIQGGYIKKQEDGTLFVTIPFFTKEQKEEFDAIAAKYLDPLLEDYSAAVNRFSDGYKKLFPKHLEADADRLCRGYFTGLYDNIVIYGTKNGILDLPPAGSVCDVMVQFK